MNGERMPGNTKKMEVHDLDNEETNCQIDEILAADRDRPFLTPRAAHADGDDNHHWCLGGSTR